MKNPWARQKRRHRIPNYLSKYRLDSDIATQLFKEDSITDKMDNEAPKKLSFLERFKRFF